MLSAAQQQALRQCLPLIFILRCEVRSNNLTAHRARLLDLNSIASHRDWSAG